jgi:protein TonB
MKAVNKLVVLLSLGALLPIAATATSTERAYIEAAAKRTDAPVPVAVVSPTNIGWEYAGSTVEVSFTVDASGSPTDLKVLSSRDETVAQAVVDAVEQWRFEPAKKNGAAVTTKVILPVRIVDGGTRFASN